MTIEIVPKIRIANFSNIQIDFENVVPIETVDSSEIVENLRQYVDLPILFLTDAGQQPLLREVVEQLGAMRSCCYPHAILALDPQFDEGPYRDLGIDVICLESKDNDYVSQSLERYIRSKFVFDKEKLNNNNIGPLPKTVDVLIVGGGITGLYATKRLQQENKSFCVVEAREIVGGIWSEYANTTSQVNTSEGAYRLLEQEFRNNRDHSPTSEILEDLYQLSVDVSDSLFTKTKAVHIDKNNDGYTTRVVRDDNEYSVQSRGLIIAVNDRVGDPRQPAWSGRELFEGTEILGSHDESRTVDWSDKNVVVVGMGAFAVENVRTALENGAKHVTVVCRRHGTVCPKIIDYLNFSTPYDDNFQHDRKSNIRNMMLWKKLYEQSGATEPECWMGKIKHEGHTISVSDIWFIAHHLKKMETVTGSIESLYDKGVIVDTGQRIEADIVVNCIGFHRNASVVKKMSDYTDTYNVNYLDKDLMYLADAYIDDDVFNSFFGSSVLEMTKFYMDVYLKFFNDEEFETMITSDGIRTLPLEDRRWSHYIAGAEALMEKYPYFYDRARQQIDERTANFHESHDLETYVAQNRREWLATHELLMGRPVSESECLPYVFEKLVEKKV